VPVPVIGVLDTLITVGSAFFSHAVKESNVAAKSSAVKNAGIGLYAK